MGDLKNYKPIPFYFLNDDLDKNELDRQLLLMKECGVEAFFLHVRDGIVNQAYGTEEFFKNIKYIIEKARDYGIEVWLYDEDSYPSGNFGGKLVIDKPEYQACSLIIDSVKVDGGIYRKVLGEVRGLCAYAITSENGTEKVQRFENCFGPVRRHWYRRETDKAYYCDMNDKKRYHIRAATAYSEIMFEQEVPNNAQLFIAYLKPVLFDMRFGTQIDCLNKKATEEYINRTHENYYKYVGQYFGKEIKGIFTDEPYCGGSLQYTDEMPDYFYKKYGYSLIDNLYKLSPLYEGETKQFRNDYYSCVSSMFVDNFLRPISTWCKNHGLIFTGHFVGEESLEGQVLGGQQLIKNLNELDIPGFDVIGNFIGDIEHPLLNLGARIVVSNAQQRGIERSLTECFALNPYNFGYEGLKKISDWLFVNGINLLVPHGFHYGYSAYQRSDAGKSFFFQDSLFDEYLRFSEYAENICGKLSTYNKEKVDTLLLLPYEILASGISFGLKPDEGLMQKNIVERLKTVIRSLEENQVMWHTCSFDQLKEATTKQGKIVLGENDYKNIIFFEDEIYTDVLSQIQGEGINCFKDKDCVESLGSDFKIYGDKKNIQVNEKCQGTKRCVFLFNNSSEYVSFETDDKKYVVYDGEKDKYYSLKGNQNKVKISLNGYQSVMLLIDDEIKNTEGEYEFPFPKKWEPDYEIKPEWVYMPKESTYAITDYSILITGKKKLKTRNRKFACVRDIYGTQDEIYKNKYVIPYFDSARRERSIYPCNVRYSTVIKGKKDYGRILFDGGSIIGDYKIFWNGKEMNQSIYKTRDYDIKNYSFNPVWKKGKNVLEIVFDKAREFDGVCGEIFVMKKDR